MESIIQAADSQTLPDEAQLKRQELMDAKASVDEATRQLKSESHHSHVPSFFLCFCFIRCYYDSDRRYCSTGVVDSIEDLTRKTRDIKNAKEELKVIVYAPLTLLASKGYMEC